jgi:hypothetical protein
MVLATSFWISLDPPIGFYVRGVGSIRAKSPDSVRDKRLCRHELRLGSCMAGVRFVRLWGTLVRVPL